MPADRTDRTRARAKLADWFAALDELKDKTVEGWSGHITSSALDEHKGEVTLHFNEGWSITLPLEGTLVEWDSGRS